MAFYLLHNYMDFITKWDEKYKPTVKESSYRTTQVYLSLISKYIKDDVLVKNVNSNLIQDMRV